MQTPSNKNTQLLTTALWYVLFEQETAQTTHLENWHLMLVNLPPGKGTQPDSHESHVKMYSNVENTFAAITPPKYVVFEVVENISGSSTA